MALSTFATAFDRAAADLITLTQAAVYVRDSSGDLTYLALDHLQNGLRAAKVSALAALVESQKQPVAAEAQMAAVGGPANIAAYQAALADIEVKAAAWNAALSSALVTIPAADLVGVAIYAQDGIETKHIQFKHFIPAAIADPLRQTQALTDLASALEALVN